MDDSLNLGKVDPPVWQVMISGKVYGPYTRGQLLAFIAENRIRPRTKIAKGDGAQFIPAEEIEDLVPALQAALTSSSNHCLLYTSPSPRDQRGSRMPSSA